MNASAVALTMFVLASMVLLAAAWFADQAGRHARSTAADRRDVKAAIAKWARQAGIEPQDAAADMADMAAALAERQAGERHFGSPGRASGWGRE